MLAGTGRLVWQGSSGSGAGGSLFLLGNNTYTGGTLLNDGAGVNFNNNNSFGTGRITWGVAQQVLADDVATAPVTLPNTVTTFAAGQLIYVGPAAAPVTFSGAWTLASGTSTLTIGNTSHATSQMTISGQDRRQRRRPGQKRQSARSFSAARTLTTAERLSTPALDRFGRPRPLSARAM